MYLANPASIDWQIGQRLGQSQRIAVGECGGDGTCWVVRQALSLGCRILLRQYRTQHGTLDYNSEHTGFPTNSVASEDLD